MKVNASSLFLDKVVDSENKKLGEIVNLVFNNKAHDSSILVFPEESSWLDLQALLDLGDKLSKDTIKSCNLPFSEQLNSLIKDGFEYSEEYIKNQGQKYLKEIDKRFKSSYYLIPVSEIGESKEKQLVLSGTLSDYTSCQNGEVFEDDFVYLGEKAYIDSCSALKITLDKGSIRGQYIKDTKGNFGKISDLVIDTDTSMVSSLKVRCLGNVVGEKSVDITKVDFEKMKYNSVFK